MRGANDYLTGAMHKAWRKGLQLVFKRGKIDTFSKNKKCIIIIHIDGSINLVEGAPKLYHARAPQITLAYG